MEERHELSSLPGGAVEVGVRKALLDLLEEVPARGAVSNVITRRAAFVFSRVELSHGVAFAILGTSDERARVSMIGEDFGFLVA